MSVDKSFSQHLGTKKLGTVHLPPNTQITPLFHIECEQEK